MSTAKRSARDYAEALSVLTEGAKSEAIPHLVRGLAETLHHNNQTNLLPMIPHLMEKIEEEQQATKTVVVETAHELTDKQRERLQVGLVKKLDGIKQIVVKEVLKPELIGGIRLRIDDRVIDHSIKHKLEQLAAKL